VPPLQRGVSRRGQKFPKEAALFYENRKVSTYKTPWVSTRGPTVRSPGGGEPKIPNLSSDEGFVKGRQERANLEAFSPASESKKGEKEMEWWERRKVESKSVRKGERKGE